MTPWLRREGPDLKNFCKKLKSKAGETLVESLAAILIFTMASIVMYSMVTAAGDINRTAKELDQQVQQQMVDVEKGEASCKTGSGTVTMTLNSLEIAKVQVDIYGGEDDSLFAFFVQIGGGSGS